jgi:glutamyl-tRNA synthetase
MTAQILSSTHEATGSAVVTRFAPSPTGYLHIGGARTALFNWLFARQAGGKFLLRIEDTDRARSTPAATQAIMDGLAWLGLDHDGEILLQFSRADRHREAALSLIESGGAYRCYLSGEEESALKEAAKAQGKAFRSPWRDASYGTPAADAPFVTRLRAPSENASIIVHDKVLGDVTTGGREIDDFILLRTDLTPTYMLAVVVDDHDMGVTHIIRGDDHLTNAARQTALINAFGWRVPVYAHIPLIHGDDGKKLSKRHGALGVEDYRDMGYLPEAMCAYLLRLGWSKGDLDILSRDEALAAFDLDGIGKSPSRLDFAKMDSVNAHFMKLEDNKQRLAEIVSANSMVRLGSKFSNMDFSELDLTGILNIPTKFQLSLSKFELQIDKLGNSFPISQKAIDNSHIFFEPGELQRVMSKLSLQIENLLPPEEFHRTMEKIAEQASAMSIKISSSIGDFVERAKTIESLTDQFEFVMDRRPISFDEKTEKILTPEARERIARAYKALAQIENWRHESIKDAISAFATSEGVGFGKVGPILRAALTGGKPAPDLGVTMEVLGREETLARLADVLS